MSMLSVEEARSRLLQEAVALGGSEAVAVGDALGRVLAEPLRSTISVPPADNSEMDGYAVRCADIASAPTPLRVAQRIAAGQTGTDLLPETAARIFTGAAIPAGADAVVMQEMTEATGDRVIVKEVPRPGQFVRRAGFDVAAGAIALDGGTLLRPQELGIASAIGATQLRVRPRLRVALLSTGDELVMPGEPLPPGRIYNSSRFMFRALLQGAGCIAEDLGIVPDRLDATRAALREAAARCDLIVTTGGVSVGEEDHVKEAIRREGAIDLWQVAMKPGKPLAFGRVGDVPVIGLPGNPVSSFVTYLLVARPFMRAQQGCRTTIIAARPMRADFDWPRPNARREFLRTRMGASGGLEIFPDQNAALISSLTWSDGLVDNPAGHPIHRGDTVAFLPFTELAA
ncbi:MAG TPA: gephyrin-like molybdotransferase Glp [Burkholderiaceae bacterium]|nr:gephyrin-like molybdotransferase Glp [Burkholderiaceae bacterium]